MKFLIDNQLPAALARYLSGKGHEATHVLDIGMAQSDDPIVWGHASTNAMVVVSKDEDFLHLCRRGKPAGRLLWVRIKNCRNATLITAFEQSLDQIVAAFDAGQTVVELR